MKVAKNNGTVLRWVTILLLLSVLCTPVMSQGIVVPNTNLRTEGNGGSGLPFSFTGGHTVRCQQVYDASQFSVVTNGGWIYQLFFRPDGAAPGFNAFISNVVIHLSTTSRGPNGLSPVFSENAGPDDTMVFWGSFNLSGGGGTSPADFSISAELTNYFWYHPSAGNLLMDVGVYPGSEIFAVPPFDAVGTAGDAVSRVWAAPAEATSGTTEAAGLVTLIAVAPVPSLRAYISNFGTATNFVAIRWPTQPTTFVLQQSSNLGTNAVWQNLPGVGGTNPVFKEYQIPISSAGPGAFFRLVGPAPPGR